MAEDSSRATTPMQEYLEDVCRVLRENQEFLLVNAKSLCDEVVELMNDAIDYVVLVTKADRSKELYVERSMIFFLHHVLMPFSYAIYPESLLGNLPGCFMQLRLVHESLVRSYFADLCYPDRALFDERLRVLGKKARSTNKLMKRLGTELGLDNELADLWNELSEEWVHTKGIVGRVVEGLLEDSGVPPWALVIPVNYTEEDLEALDYLRRQISRFRRLLAATLEKYEQAIGF